MKIGESHQYYLSDLNYDLQRKNLIKLLKKENYKDYDDII